MRKHLLLLFVVFFGCSDVDMLKITTISPQGIVTQPNELGLPPGSLAASENIVIRRPGVIEPRRAFEDIVTLGSHLARPSRKMVPVGNYVLDALANVFDASATGSLYWGGGNVDTSAPTRDGTTGYRFLPGQVQVSATRDRFFVTDKYGVLVLDSELDTVSRVAGVAAPTYIDIDVNAGSGDVLLASKFVGYRALIRRRLGSYTFQGAASAAFVTLNFGADCIPSITVSLPYLSVQVGDEIELYRTEQQDEAELVDDRYRYAISYVVTAPDIAAGFATFLDTAVSLDADLYFNDTQDGSGQNNFPPPASRDVFTFKEVTFYAPTSLPAERQLGIPYGLGSLDDTEKRTHGIGFRNFTGDWTNGSPTVLNVSSTEGLVPGQQVHTFVSGIVATTTISSIVGTTITLSANATTTVAGGTIQAQDVLEVNGHKVTIDTLSLFIQRMSLLTTATPTVFPNVQVREDLVVTQPVILTLVNLVPGNQPFTLRATNGQNYSPVLPEISATVETVSPEVQTSTVVFSKIGQPECVPPFAFSFKVGNGQFLRMFATKDSLFVMTTKGIYRVVGQGDQWAAYPFNLDENLLAPDLVTSAENMIYAQTDNGLVMFNEDGLQNISRQFLGDALGDSFASVWSTTADNWFAQLAADTTNKEIWLHYGSDPDGDGSFAYVWNYETKTFGRASSEFTALTYSQARKSIFAGNAIIYMTESSDYVDSALISFNEMPAEDAGELEQWVDVTLQFAQVANIPDREIEVDFDGDFYPALVPFAETGKVKKVLPVTRNKAYSPTNQMTITIQSDAGNIGYFQLKAISWRYRNASETLER